jgi:hypothetical protein
MISEQGRGEEEEEESEEREVRRMRFAFNHTERVVMGRTVIHDECLDTLEPPGNAESAAVPPERYCDAAGF